MKEALCPILVSLSERLVAQVSYFIEVCYLRETLWFPRHFDSANSIVAILSSQIPNSLVEDVASADVDWFHCLEFEFAE
jgi:hypothetical protein